MKNIYLAGKIDKGTDDWRYFLVDELPEAVKSCFVNIYEGSQWPILEDSIFGRFNYTGPYCVRDDHGFDVHGDDSHGTGCNRDDITLEECHGQSVLSLGDERRQWTVESCKRAIERSDLVFAWIDCIDCYGTIAEIGYARALQKTIWIAGPKQFRDMWFIYQMADATLFKDWSAKSALQTFLMEWEKKHVQFDSPIEQKFWVDWRGTPWFSDNAFQLTIQHPIGKYRVDFAHIPTKTVIELDGFATHSSTEDIANDRRRQREIEAMGWRVVRFGGKEIHHDTPKCVREVYEILCRKLGREYEVK